MCRVPVDSTLAATVAPTVAFRRSRRLSFSCMLVPPFDAMMKPFWSCESWSLPPPRPAPGFVHHKETSEWPRPDPGLSLPRLHRCDQPLHRDPPSLAGGPVQRVAHHRTSVSVLETGAVRFHGALPA